MKLKKLFAVAVTTIPLVLVMPASAVTVVVDTAVGVGATPALPIPVSTGAVRAPSAAPAANATVSGTLSTPEVTGPARATDAPATTGQAPSTAGGTGRTQQRRPVTPPDSSGAKDSSKGAIVPEIVYDDPTAFRFSVEAGYASQHLWRGIDIVQLTSYNHQVPGRLDKAESDVSFFGANATYKGFALGIKYIESIDDELNPFFAPLLTDLDSYQELVISTNYTRELLPKGQLTGTFGFDFYYYPNGEFWGVDHQGMFYARVSSALHKWANPFLEVFYNVATDSDGNGLASNPAFRGASDSDLVEGYGAEIGINGGDRFFSNDYVTVGLTYSISTFVKQDYAFEDDGFSHLVLTVGLPVLVGKNLTITPSVTYSEAFQDVGKPGAPIGNQTYYSRSSAWNEPGWSAAVKASWQF